MTPERVMEMFACMRMHLINKKYNYHQYKGKRKSRSEVLSFAYLFSRKYNEETFYDFLLANNLEFTKKAGSPPGFIGDLLEQDAQSVYNEYQKFLESKSYHLERDLKKLLSYGEDLKNFDFVFGKVLKNEVSFRTIVLLNAFTSLKKSWKDSSILYEEYDLFFEKANLLLQIPKELFMASLLKARESV